ncbi:conserved hypothetical protein [Culex quinquefasciatus]|uniref:THD domain-containing protein n=1 Tax=Culex quinquefasciatus TaxID=7176 RepID=B0WVT2_CULQU|nr:conserved hypothetical protein [Culex quinquefasciatus]|eukprot:XP_001861504.1 conserved hypothetical protein [Culex quinquefasciatus]
MTAESLKPFLSPPSALGTVLTGGGDCRDRKTVAKNVLTIGGSVILFVLFGSVIGLEIWNVNRITDLQRDVDSLRQQVHELTTSHRRIESLEDFSEFEEAYDTNDIQPNSDEYEEEEEEPFEGGDRDVEEGSTSVFGVPDYHADDIETEISVTATASSSNSNSVGADGKRRARSISGMTYQGVPIMEESYLNRQQQHNRTRHHPRQYQQHPGQGPHYQQMRQRPEETASPPPQLKLKWDDEGHREIPSRHQLSTSGSVDVGRHSGLRRHHHPQAGSTTAQPDGTVPSYVRRNEFGRSEKYAESMQPNKFAPDYTTKAPGPTHNRHSRVMITNGENKYQKVIKNPGTYMESRQPPVQRVGRLMRKSAPAPRVTALHLVKNHSHINEHRATDHTRWLWHAADQANRDALTSSGVFKLSQRGLLTVNDTGLYFVYAQITYMDQSVNSGFSIMVNGRKHASCSVHGQYNEKANTCYTAALVDLDNNSQIEIRDMDTRRAYLPYHEKTFFGLYKLGRRPVSATTA